MQLLAASTGRRTQADQAPCMRDQGQTISGAEKRTVDQGSRERCAAATQCDAARPVHCERSTAMYKNKRQQGDESESRGRHQIGRSDGVHRLADLASAELRRSVRATTRPGARRDRRGSSLGQDAATCRGREPRRSSSRPRASSSCKVSEAEAAHAHGRVVDPPDAEVCVAVSLRSAAGHEHVSESKAAPDFRKRLRYYERTSRRQTGRTRLGSRGSARQRRSACTSPPSSCGQASPRTIARCPSKGTDPSF